ncbi:MAG TPA: hypothetical protein VFZ36_04015 [Vicinamibacterales bacterium]
MAEDVLATIERLAAAKPLRPGLRIRFGWSMLTLREMNGEWILCEPDFDGDPLNDVRPDISTTLDVVSRQTAFARRVGVRPVDATFDQFILIGRGAWDAHDIQLFRDESRDADDSGWSLAPANAPSAGDRDAEYDAVRTFDALRKRPSILPVLVLPPGYAVTMAGDKVGFILDPDGNARP